MTSPMRRQTGPGGLRARGRRFLWSRRRVLVRLACWSVLETGQIFATGYLLTHATRRTRLLVAHRAVFGDAELA